MRRYLLLVLISVTSLRLAAATAVVREVDPCLTLRASPKTNAASVACLPSGTRVKLVASAPYWRQVDVNGKRGWAAKKFLQEEPTGEATTATDERWLEVHFADAGQGDGIWIHTPDDGVANGRFEGKNILIDGGPDAKAPQNAFLAYLQEFAHRDAVIDALFISHPHDDHYPGADGILRNFDVRTIYEAGFPKEGPKYAAFLNLAKSEPGADLRFGRESFGSLEWGAELDAAILYGYPGASEGLGRDSTLENNASIVLRLQYGDHTFLFMGDAEGKERDDDPSDDAQFVERVLLRDVPASRLKATVLKIAHHGSETSSTNQFIRAVDPEIVVVSSGRRPYSGTFLPRPSTLKRYCCHNPAIRIYRTDQDDEIEGRTARDDADADHVIIRTNGKTLQVIAHSNGEPISMDRCDPECDVP